MQSFLHSVKLRTELVQGGTANMKKLIVCAGALVLASLSVLLWNVGGSESPDGTAPDSARSVPTKSTRTAAAAPTASASLASAPALSGAMETPAGAASAQPLSPQAENDRIRTVLRNSGKARADELDRSASLIAERLVRDIKSLGSSASLLEFECLAAGCAGTIEVEHSDVPDTSIKNVILGMNHNSGHSTPNSIADWPGSRVIPPPVVRGGKTLMSFYLIRPDLTQVPQF